MATLVRFAAPNFGNDVAEGGVLSHQLTLSSPSSTEVRVTVRGSNYAGADIDVSDKVVIFAPGQTSATFTTNAYQDDLYEGNEIFTFGIVSALGAEIDRSTDSAGTIYGYVLDDDRPTLPTVRFAAPNFGNDVAEGGVLSHQLTLSLPSSTEVRVTVRGSNYAGADIDVSDKVVIFAPGQTSATFTTNAYQDSLYEGSEIFTFAIVSALGAEIDRSTDSPGTIYGYVLDDDDAPDRIPPSIAITNSGGLTNAATQTVTGTIGLADVGRTVTIAEGSVELGTALAGLDGFWSTSVTLSGDGAHSLTARATDAAGNVGLSAAVTYILMAADSASFGTVTNDPHSPGGEVYALYDGLLGRAPDPLGLEFWADAFRDGVAPRDLAAGFLDSAEGKARAGAIDDAAFVTQLYNATLHRNPDSDGLKFWVDALKSGATRADVGAGFALSDEHLANIRPALDAGLFVPDADASAVARVYYTMLGRAPDAGGLKFWTDAIKSGTPLASETQSFLDTPKAKARVGSLTTEQYVDSVYMNALGRHAEADGLHFWADAIDHHLASRVDVTTAIGQSPEAQAHLAPLIEQGWHLA